MNFNFKPFIINLIFYPYFNNLYNEILSAFSRLKPNVEFNEFSENIIHSLLVKYT